MKCTVFEVCSLPRYCQTDKFVRFFKSGKQNLVVDSVECCRQIEQTRDRNTSGVSGGCDVVEHFQKFRPCFEIVFFGNGVIIILNESGKTSSTSDLLKSSVMHGATVSALCLISRDGTGSRAQVFSSDFLRRPSTSSFVTGENKSIVVDAVGTMSGGFALDVSARISSTFLEKKTLEIRRRVFSRDARAGVGETGESLPELFRVSSTIVDLLAQALALLPEHLMHCLLSINQN